MSSSRGSSSELVWHCCECSKGSPFEPFPSSEHGLSWSEWEVVTKASNSFAAPEISTSANDRLPCLLGDAARCSQVFDIERNGDPKIQWFMYYDFVVTKDEAYYELQPGYLPTDKYPSRRGVKKRMSNGERIYACEVLDCKAEPFTRLHDLERHFTRIHKEAREQTNCGYSKCHPSGTSWKDHSREHYREYHSEDQLKRDQSSKNSKALSSGHIDSGDPNWWRCPKCVCRVEVEADGYIRPDHKVTCEPDMVARRWRFDLPKDLDLGAEIIPGVSIDEKVLLMRQVKRREGCRSSPISIHEENGLGGVYHSEFWYISCHRLMLLVCFMAGCWMFASFLWLSQRMELEISSEFMSQIIDMAMKVLPVLVTKSSHLVSSTWILLSYLMASALWSVSMISWGATSSQWPGPKYCYSYILAAGIFWSLKGVRAAELFLAFLPLSITVGVWLYTICDGLILIIRKFRESNGGHCGYNRMTSPIQDQERVRQDLEMNVKRQFLKN